MSAPVLPVQQLILFTFMIFTHDMLANYWRLIRLGTYSTKFLLQCIALFRSCQLYGTSQACPFWDYLS